MMKLMLLHKKLLRLISHKEDFLVAKLHNNKVINLNKINKTIKKENKIKTNISINKETNHNINIKVETRILTTINPITMETKTLTTNPIMVEIRTLVETTRTSMVIRTSIKIKTSKKEIDFYLRTLFINLIF